MATGRYPIEVWIGVAIAFGHKSNENPYPSVFLIGIASCRCRLTSGYFFARFYTAAQGQKQDGKEEL